MPKRYSRQFRKMVAELICVQKEGTIRTAEEFGVPLKTVENWVTIHTASMMTTSQPSSSWKQQGRR